MPALDAACALISQRFVSSGDIVPNEAENTLTNWIDRAATPAHDKAIAAPLDDLARLEFQHPETGAKMIFLIVCAISICCWIRRSEVRK